MYSLLTTSIHEGYLYYITDGRSMKEGTVEGGGGWNKHITVLIVWNYINYMRGPLFYMFYYVQTS